jgi:hypothetical protein
MEIDGEPTYGGPYNSYTIPEWDEEDAEFVRRNYDHDHGGWNDGDEWCPVDDDVKINYLLRQLSILRDWKAQQMQVESQWDEQQIAKLLGAKLGQSCRKVIQEKVPQLVTLLEEAREALEMFSGHYSSGINPYLDRAWLQTRGVLTKLKQATP